MQAKGKLSAIPLLRQAKGKTKFLLPHLIPMITFLHTPLPLRHQPLTTRPQGPAVTPIHQGIRQVLTTHIQGLSQVLATHHLQGLVTSK